MEVRCGTGTKRMGKKYLLDSNILIDYLGGRMSLSAADATSRMVDSGSNLSFISKIEVLRYDMPQSEYAKLKEFINCSTVFSVDDTIVDKTIEICRGSKIKLPDAVIAATAIINDMVLVTRNVDDFKNVEGLVMINPWDSAN
jgi:predicted nucleic acid-binding protein